MQPPTFVSRTRRKSATQRAARTCRSFRAKIEDVFDEPACDKNQAKSDKERKKGCSKPLTPGAAAGGCAFDGAKIVLAADHRRRASHSRSARLRGQQLGQSPRRVVRAAALSHLVHHRSCPNSTSSWAMARRSCGRRSRSSSRRITRRRCSSTRPASPSLIGDDIEAVCTPRHAKSSAFRSFRSTRRASPGSKNLGNKLAGETLLDHVIGTMEPAVSTPTDINILGEYNLVGRILAGEAAVRAGSASASTACITGDARYADVASAHRASVNMMVCSAALINRGAQDGGALGHSLFRGLVLRRLRHLRRAAQHRTPAGAAGRAGRSRRPHRSSDRSRRRRASGNVSSPIARASRASACCSTPAASSPGRSSPP